MANVYFAQPLLVTLGRDFSISTATLGAVVTLTQIGYGLGLFFLVPLGDMLDRRRLIVAQLLLLAVALTAVGTADYRGAPARGPRRCGAARGGHPDVGGLRRVPRPTRGARTGRRPGDQRCGHRHPARPHRIRPPGRPRRLALRLPLFGGSHLRARPGTPPRCCRPATVARQRPGRTGNCCAPPSRCSRASASFGAGPARPADLRRLQHSVEQRRAAAQRTPALLVPHRNRSVRTGRSRGRPRCHRGRPPERPRASPSEPPASAWPCSPSPGCPWPSPGTRSGRWRSA